MRAAGLLCAIAVVSTFARAAESVPMPRLHDSTATFTAFWDANNTKPPTEQVAAFKTSVAPTFPGFYNAERFKSFLTPAQYDERIVTAAKEFPAIRAAYTRKAQQFESELPHYIATFRQTFPDFEPPADIHVLHSLGEMDGGMRTIDGKQTFIFGVDVMAQVHGTGNESAFFDHELFHHYHFPYLAACGDAGIWRSLWLEGLATYVSKVMNPQATEQEMLLDLPAGMAADTRAVLPQALAQLESVLDRDDEGTYAGLFLRRGNGETLPRRRGYYLGYLVAQEAGKTHDVRALAHMDCAASKALVFATVHQLRAAAH